ncbi:MAG: hypothetical protein Q7T57_07035, partial [Dehalococcoidales bacterium]|nr:hypothetical protein [Dehalococcoidales bacterium]
MSGEEVDAAMRGGRAADDEEEIEISDDDAPIARTASRTTKYQQSSTAKHGWEDDMDDEIGSSSRTRTGNVRPTTGGGDSEEIIISDDEAPVTTKHVPPARAAITNKSQMRAAAQPVEENVSIEFDVDEEENIPPRSKNRPAAAAPSTHSFVKHQHQDESIEIDYDDYVVPAKSSGQSVRGAPLPKRPSHSAEEDIEIDDDDDASPPSRSTLSHNVTPIPAAIRPIMPMPVMRAPTLVEVDEIDEDEEIQSPRSKAAAQAKSKAAEILAQQNSLLAPPQQTHEESYSEVFDSVDASGMMQATSTAPLQPDDEYYEDDVEPMEEEKSHAQKPAAFTIQVQAPNGSAVLAAPVVSAVPTASVPAAVRSRR